MEVASGGYLTSFLTFFMHFGNSLFDYLWNFFVCYGSNQQLLYEAEYDLKMSPNAVDNFWNQHNIIPHMTRKLNSINCFIIHFKYF